MADLLSFGDTGAAPVPPEQQPSSPAPMAAPPLPPPPPSSNFGALNAAGSFDDTGLDDFFRTAGAPPTFAPPVASAAVVPPPASPQQSSTATATATATETTLAAARKQWLTDYYMKQNPSKADTVDGMLVKYLGKEELLMSKLASKYGVLPVPIPTAASLAAMQASKHQDLLGGIAPAREPQKKRASQIDQQFLETLSPEFIAEQEKLMERIKDGDTNHKDRRAITPPRGRTDERSRHRRGGKMQRRSSSLPIRKGLLC